MHDAHELRISVEPPFHHRAFLAYLRIRQIAAVEHVDHSSYSRLVATPSGPAAVQLDFTESSAGVISLHLRAADREISDLSRKARRFVCANINPSDVTRALAGIQVLEPLVERWPGVRIPGTFDPWELSVRAVLGQQVSVGRAATLANQITQDFGENIRGFEDIGLSKMFPTPQSLKAAAFEQYGLPRSRADAIRTLAWKAELVRDICTPRHLKRESLLAIKGIGEWTADYVSIRGWNDLDIFPGKDGGIRSALQDSSDEPAAAEERINAAARPLRSFAAIYLWTTFLDP